MMAAFDPSTFDPDFAGPADWAAMYRAHGLQIVPSLPPKRGTAWKRPSIKWEPLVNEFASDLTFERWYGPDGTFVRNDNLGMVAGSASGHIFVLDLDEHTNPAARLWWEQLLHTWHDGEDIETWTQVTGGGGRQMLFRYPEGWHAPTNRTPLGVDIRGQGGFAVLPPSRHTSGQDYAWQPGRAPWDMPDGPAAAPQWLLEAIEKLVAEHGGSESGGTPAERTPSPGGDYDGFGNRVDGREEAMRDLVWAAVVNLWRQAPIPLTAAESEAECAKAYEVYERGVKSRLSGPDKTASLEREGRGPSAFGEKWRRAMAQWDTKVAEAGRERPKAAERADAPFDGPPEAGPRPKLAVQSAFPIDGGAIERRKWIIPGLLIRRHLSVLVAPPGSGKSLLTLQIAIAAAVGMTWGGFTIREPARVLVVNAEDDLDEMRRRLWAAAESMGVDQAAIGDNLMLAEAPEHIVVARTDARSKSVVRTPLVADLIETVRENRIDMIVVDPFAETFEGDENSNSEVKWAGIIWREIARQTNSAAFLVHHTRKYAGGMAGDADASRGGGALIGTARVVTTLFAMTEDEAGVMNVSPAERTHFVRFDDAKANMSLVTGVARWFRKEARLLPNGSMTLPGDEVGVLVPWSPPGMFDGISSQTIGQLLDTIDRGILDENGDPTGRFYTPSATTTDKSRWVGTLISAHLGCDEDRSKQIAREWLKSGLLVVFDYDDRKSTRKGLRVDHEKRPDRSAE